MSSRIIPEYLTFDDVLMKPGASSVLPAQVSTATRLTRAIKLSIPIISAAMDTVTEARLAIAMAQAGGLGIIHKNLEPADQAEHVRQVKRFESGMVVNPITIGPDATLGDVLALKERHKISGIPVVDGRGKLVGIITNRDVRFATDLNMKVADLMTNENLVTVRAGVDRTEAKAPAAQVPHREAHRRGRRLPLRRAHHRERHGKGRRPSARRQGRARALARRRGHRHG